MSQPDFERQLQALVDRAVRADPHEPDLMPTLRHRLTANPRWRQTSPSRRQSLVAVISTLLLVALFAASFVLLRSGAGGVPAGNGTANQPTKATARPSKPDWHVVDGTGMSFQIAAIDADITRTAVRYTLSGAPSTGLIPAGALLSDAQGAAYDLFAASWSTGSDGLLEFTPLPLEAAGVAEALTLTVKAWQTPADSGGEPTIYQGIWSATAQVTPRVSTKQSLTVAPQRHGGVAIQPLWLATAHPSTIDGVPGGIVVMLQMSGLPSDTFVYSLTDFATAFPYAPLVLSQPGHATMALQGAAGWHSPPGVLRLITQLNPTALPKGSIGTTESVQIEASFFGSMPDAPAALTLHIDRLPLVRVEADSATLTPAAIDGPWSFDLPLT